jgi:Peptidase family M1 domain
MLRITGFALVGLLWAGTPAGLRATAVPEPDGVSQLLTRLEGVLRSGQPQAYSALLSPLADRQLADDFATAVVQPGVTRAVVRERFRTPLEGTLPGEGYQLTVEALIESGDVARLTTWSLDVKRLHEPTPDAGGGEWAIAGQRLLGTLPALYRLSLDQVTQFSARTLVVTAEDLEFTIPDADVFVAKAGTEPTAIVVLGRGQMRFSPTQAAERGQVKIFSGAEVLTTPVDALFVRVPPGEFDRHVSGVLEPRSVNARQWQQAAEVFREEAGHSFGLDLGDLSSGNWSMLPTSGDFLAEIRTRRFGGLTYVRSTSDPEDISLFQRSRRRNISVYESAGHLATLGRFYSDDDRAEYKVLSYDIDSSFEPARRWLDGRTRLRIQVIAPSVNTLTFRLADSLGVRSVTSPQYGPLLAVRVRGQQSVVVSLPTSVQAGLPITLDVAYSGVIRPQPTNQEAMGQYPTVLDEQPSVQLEESYLYSNQSYWYPQAPASGYATATLHVSVPRYYSCVASGELVKSVVTDPPEGSAVPPSRHFTFVARRPARYFACLITPLVQTASRVLRMGGKTEPGGTRAADVSLNLEVKANPRLRGLAKPLANTASEILEYYVSLLGDMPYPDATIAAVEWTMPGGHSPAYMAVLNQPVPGAPAVNYRNDPAFFDNFPEFFIAHELAHQWWGQAVGWKNYHEQWLSEGLAQYFAALYAGKSRGEATFDAILGRFREWSFKDSDQGPIYLGYRVGHIKGDSRVFRAVVYDKSAAVLHMLRRLVGDDAFFRGLRRFYSTWRFKKAGSDDLRRAMEEESGMVLDRFFERWIYGDRLPTVTYSTAVEETAAGRVAVVRFHQAGEIFDVPVTVTFDYADRPSSDVVAKITDQTAVLRVPVSAGLRKIEINRDNAALARFTETRAPKG